MDQGCKRAYEMIAVVIRDFAHLKIMHLIMKRFIRHKLPFIVIHYDVPRASKEYNRATLKRLKLSSGDIIDKAKKIIPYKNDQQLIDILVKNRCKKLVVIEFPLTHRTIRKKIKKNGIKVYSINYLTDSMWINDYSAITDVYRTFYTTEHIRKFHFDLMNKPINNEITKCMGSPLFNQVKNISSGDETAVLLPNIRASEVPKAFGSPKNFISIIKNIHKQTGPLIFKTRKKQWMPIEIEKFAREIVYDGNIMCPSALSKVLKRSNKVIIFYSSGIYEAVYSGAYVINIISDKGQWRWPINILNKYFSDSPGSLYNFNGIVKSVNTKDAVSGNFSLDGFNQEQRKKWIEMFMPNIPDSPVDAIVDEIIKS